MELEPLRCCSLLDLLSTLGLPGPCVDLYQAFITLIINALIEGSGINIEREGNKAVVSLIDGLIQGSPGVTVTQNPDGTYTITVDVVPDPLVFADSSTIDVNGSGTGVDPYVFSLDPGAISAGVGVSITVNPDDTLVISSPLVAGAGIALVSNVDGSYTISATATEPVLDDTPTINVTGTGTPGDPYLFSFTPGAITAGAGIGVVQNGDGTFTISNTTPVLNFGDSATNVLGGTGTPGDPYTFTFAPGSLVAGPGINLVQAPNGVYTISAPLVLLQFWAEQYSAAQGITSWNAVNNSIAGFRNIRGFLLNRIVLAAVAPALGTDSVDLHQGAAATQTASGSNSGIVAGLNNTVAGPTSFIGAGNSNILRANASLSIIGAGTGNDIGLTAATNGGILAGNLNEIRGNNGVVLGGQDNKSGIVNGVVGGFRSIVGAGTLNQVGARDSGVLTGNSNRIAGNITDANDGSNAIVAGSTNNIVTLAPATVSACAILCGRLNTIGNAGVATTVTSSSILSGQNIVMVANNTYNPPLAASSSTNIQEYTQSSGVEELNGSSAGGNRVRMSASHSLAMGHALMVDSSARSSFTSGSYLHNTSPHSTLLGRHGHSSSAVEEVGSLVLCSGTYNDPSPSVVMGRNREGGVLLSDTVELSGENVSYYFPKSKMFPSAKEGRDMGLFVTLNDDGSVSPAREGQTIFGVTVPRTGLVLNAQNHHWHGKYIKDDFGVIQTRESYIDSFLDLLSNLYEKEDLRLSDVDSLTEKEVEERRTAMEAYVTSQKTKQRAWDAIHASLVSLPVEQDSSSLISWAIYHYGPMWPALKRLEGMELKARSVPLLSPDYEASRAYMARSERVDEWIPIATKGLVRVRVASPLPIGSFCSPKNGLAVSSSSSPLRVVGQVSASVVTILL